MEVRGRWFGVRGRRFVRPALVLIAADGSEQRVLAELDDKPWAAQDGEAWRAAFMVDDVGAAAGLELTVAPDITVTLRGERPGGAAPAPAAATRSRGVTSPRRASTSRAVDSDRLASRLTAAEASLSQERERRDEAERALERQRADARQTLTELGRVQAELELARAADREALQTTALLDAARRDNHAAQARYEALSAEHDRALRDQAELREQLDASATALDGVRSELAAERARHADTKQRSAREERDGREERSARGPAESLAHRPAATAVHTPPPSRSDRPLNPSLHSRNWLLRMLVVVVIAAFLLAVYLVLHSTVL